LNSRPDLSSADFDIFKTFDFENKKLKATVSRLHRQLGNFLKSRLIDFEKLKRFTAVSV
jgi:hypothetical protein